MKRAYGIIGVAVLLAATAALFAACGGGGGSGGGDGGGGGGGGGGGVDSLYTGKTTQATITPQGVKDTLASTAGIIPSCTATGVTEKLVDTKGNGLISVFSATKHVLKSASAKITGKSVALIPSSAPSTKPVTGKCGGTLSYPTWSHASGTTTIAITWANYCTQDSSGNQQIVNGTLSAVDNGTPGATGPVTNKLTAEIPKITVVKKDSTGKITAQQTIGVAGFVYTPASGATPDASNLPGRFTISTLVVNDDKNKTSYMAKDVVVTTSKSGTDTQVTMSARTYKDTSGFSDITTDAPFVIDSSQNLKAGKMSFSGAKDTKTTLTVVPGTGQTFDVDVNGTALTGTQLKCNGVAK